MQILEKAKFYLDRAMHGKIEKTSSGPRNLALNTLKHDPNFKNDMDKYLLKAYKVIREQDLKTVE